jgi:hypothetical protein
MCIRPFTFQRQWNTNLARGLKTVAISFLNEGGSTFGVRATEHGPGWKLGLSLARLRY